MIFFLCCCAVCRLHPVWRRTCYEHSSLGVRSMWASLAAYLALRRCLCLLGSMPSCKNVEYSFHRYASASCCLLDMWRSWCEVLGVWDTNVLCVWHYYYYLHSYKMNKHWHMYSENNNNNKAAWLSAEKKELSAKKLVTECCWQEVVQFVLT